MRSALLVLLAAGLGCAAEPPRVEWAKVESETLNHYLSLIRIDTSNPPGNESRAVEYLKTVLDREGIPYKTYELEPNRANLVARLKGSGAKRPLLVMGHTDVVGVQREKWSVDPFAGLRKDGYVYGRGTQDDKDNLTAALMLMVLLKRSQAPLDRDVIFLAEAGEESTSRVGIDFMVKEHFDEIDAEYCLAEGGVITPKDGKAQAVMIATTEKVPRWTRLVAHGTAGHGSRPQLDNAVVRLSQAVAKVGVWQTPMRLNDTTRTYFERLATISPPEAKARYLHVADPGQTQAIQQYFAEHEPGHYSMLRTSVVPTILKAGFRANVIPSEAEATLDVRALPDEDMTRFYAEMKKIIGDAKVEIVPPTTAGRPVAPPSRLDTPVFQALEAVQKRMYPGAVTLPQMSTGATDMAQLRAKGVQCYGIGPMVPEEDRGTRGAHGDDERLAESALYDFVRFLWNVTWEIAGKR